MIVQTLKDSDLAAYDSLARLHGTLFNHVEWITLFGDKMQTLGIYEDGGQLVGGLSFYRERRFGLTVFRWAPFTPTCGPFLEIKAQNPVVILETRRKALESMIAYLEKQSPAIVMLALDQQIVDALPFFWHGYKVIPYYTYLIDLTFSLDQMLKNMSSIRRNDVSKAVRDGLVVRQTMDMDVVKNLVLATMGRQKKFVNMTCLEAILFRYANKSNSFAFTTYRGDTPLSTCFVVHDTLTAYYLLGGYSAEERHHGAGASAMFEAIKHAQKIGLKTFDFEGSVIPPIERYFRGFGGRLTPYLTINKAWLPIEMALKLVRRQVF
jgi:hypothetical protein